MKIKWILLTLGLFSISCAQPYEQALREAGPGKKKMEVYNFDYWNLQNKSFAGAKLYSSSFVGADLRHTNFSKADLRQTDFRRANLYKANFSRSNVHRAFLFEAQLTGAIFDHADFRGADFSHYLLKEASFQHARLENANFRGANLVRANFSQSLLSNANFKFANLAESKFQKTRLEGVNLSQLNLKDADFSNAKLIDINFVGSNLEGANFSGATLKNVTFTGVRLHNADFSGAKITDSDFTKTRLKGSDFTGAKLTKVILTDLSYPEPIFTQAEFHNMIFADLDLSMGSFRESKFYNSKFVRSSLLASDFSDSYGENLLFQYSDLSISDASGANFEKTRFDNSNFQGATHEGMKFPKIVEPKTGMTFIQLPQSCYQMGDLFKENRGFSATPHMVCLSDYWLASTEVTQEVFLKITGKNPSKHQMPEANSPVEQVTITDIQEFITKLNQNSKWKLRLPTEAEWEYACRGLGQKVRFGNDSNNARADAMAFRSGLKEGEQESKNANGEKIHIIGGNWSRPVPIDTFTPNALGFSDFSGNVAEVVADHWNSKAYDSHGTLNPKIANIKGNWAFVKRGGSFKSDPGDITCAKRAFIKNIEPVDDTGFRLALSSVPEEKP